MDDIEHWTIRVCPECGRLAGNFCYGPRTNEHPRANVIEVEVVRADLHQGAVGLIRWAENALGIDTLGGLPMWNEVRLVGRKLGEYLDQHGGRQAVPVSEHARERKNA